MSETYKQAPRLIHRGSKFRNQSPNFYQLPQNLMSTIFYELNGKCGNQIKLMCVLIGTAGNGSFRVSQRWMMEQTGMDESGYKRARKALIDRKWISLENGCLYVNFDEIWNQRYQAPPDAIASGFDGEASDPDETPSGGDAWASGIPTGMKAPASDMGWSDETPGPDNTPGCIRSTRDASCGTGDASDPSRGAMTTPIINNNIEEHKGYNTKVLPPHAAVGRHEGREPERRKKMLSYDFLDDE
ncbi:MAG: hypothetical protein IJ466_05890 [Clostridia bacterium]|nr:hypothetical protein [Clostridia bacterium]